MPNASPAQRPAATSGQRIHISLLALPDTMASSLMGPYDVFQVFGILSTFDNSVPTVSPFQVEIVSPQLNLAPSPSGLSIKAPRLLREMERTDIVLLPAILVENGRWIRGRYPEVVAWLRRQHARGAMLCSACSGVLLLAETGLLDGLDATIHWAYEKTFRENFPQVNLRLEEVLIATGVRQEFVMSGGSASWHDLVLFLVARQVGPAAAQAIAKFMLLQWHRDGQAPYVPFAPPTDHHDEVIRQLQEWLRHHYAVANPVGELVRQSGLPERTLKRRFARATGMTPIVYVQHVRVEEAKRRLERSNVPVEEISYEVGYEDPASFRRLFRRLTHVTPGQYRSQFRLPPFASKLTRA